MSPKKVFWQLDLPESHEKHQQRLELFSTVRVGTVGASWWFARTQTSAEGAKLMTDCLASLGAKGLDMGWTHPHFGSFPYFGSDLAALFHNQVANPYFTGNSYLGCCGISTLTVSCKQFEHRYSEKKPFGQLSCHSGRRDTKLLAHNQKDFGLTLKKHPIHEDMMEDCS